MKKFNEYIKEAYNGLGTLNDWDNESLEERLESTTQQLMELQEEINFINKIIYKRRESKEVEYSTDLPASIFDFNKKQLEFIFEGGHQVTGKKYDLSRKYFEQLKGVMDSGFNPDTLEVRFNISGANCSDVLDEDEENYVTNEECIKSIKFLGDNLKRIDGAVSFGYYPCFHDGFHQVGIKYFSDKDIDKVYNRYESKKFTSIDSILRDLVEEDLQEKRWSEE